MVKVEVSDLARERLPRMAKLLRDDAANPTGVKFDLGVWAIPADTDPDAPARWPTDVKVPLDCGTKACAFGLAAISGAFAAEGLTYMIGDGVHVVQGSLVPVLERYDAANPPVHFYAAAALFDINVSDARYFFDPECYDGTPREAAGEIAVAERIETYLMGEVDQDFHPDYYDNEDDHYGDEDED